MPLEEVEQFYNAIRGGATPKLHKSILSVSLTDNFPFELKESEGYKFTQRTNGSDTMPFVHAGTTFAKREIFEEIGGYSEDYVGYGWEDSDIQWKLEQKIGMTKIKGLTVTHLDHKRSYFEQEQFKQNKKKFFRRVREGVVKAIENDIKNYELIGLGGTSQVYKLY